MTEEANFAIDILWLLKFSRNMSYENWYMNIPSKKDIAISKPINPIINFLRSVNIIFLYQITNLGSRNQMYKQETLLRQENLSRIVPFSKIDHIGKPV